jgi:uncharacterized protein YecE (DUF72 family)
MGKIFIGTSGWMYDHWHGIFYPENLPKEEWLSYYQRYFSTVEINNTFYHLPKEATFKRWKKLAKRNFIFSVKANRFITHIKRLKDCREPLNLFVKRAKLLKNNLGPILYQLPPKWKLNLERFDSFIKLLPKKMVNVFEFRDPRWFNREIYTLLKRNKLVFCIYSMPGIDCPYQITAENIYIRMHGGSILYGSNYSLQELKELADFIKTQSKKLQNIYVYFNNDAYGFAVKNALKLQELVS